MIRSKPSSRSRALLGLLALALVALALAALGDWPGAEPGGGLQQLAPLGGPEAAAANELEPGAGRQASEAPLASAPGAGRQDATHAGLTSHTLAEDEGVAVAGTALDHATGAALGGVQVLAQGEGWESAATSDASGAFELRVIPGSTALLEAGRAGYAPLRRALRGVGDEGDDAAEDLVLYLRPGAVLAGQLSGVEPSLLAGGLVHAWNLTLDPRCEGEGLEAEPDAQGAFVFEDLAGGLYTLLASVPGHRPAYLARVTVPDGERVEVELSLAAGATVSGTVMTPDGTPRAGVRVEASWDQKGVGRGLRALGERTTRSAEDGSYELAGLASGRVSVVAVDELGTRRGERVEVTEDAEALELDLVLPLPGSLAGVVRTSSGLGVAGAEVQVLLRRGRPGAMFMDEGASGDLDLLVDGAGEDELRVTADLNGRFELDPVSAGRRLELRAFRSREGERGTGAISLLGETRSLTLESEEQREDIVLEVTEPREVRVRVLEPTGQPVPGVELAFGWDGSGGSMKRVWMARGVTDEEGRCVLPAAVAGSWTLEVGGPVVYRHTRTFRVPPAPAAVPEVVAFAHLGEFVEGAVVDGLGDAVPLARVRGHLAAPLDPTLAKHKRAEARADAYGRFRLGPLAPGTWELTASAAGHEPSLSPVVVRTADRDFVELELERGTPPGTTTVHGRLFVTDGGELEGFFIDPRRGGAVELDGDRFRMTGVRSGEVALRIGARGYLAHSTGPLRLMPGMELNLGLVELAPAGGLRVYARDSRGKPLEAFSAKLEPLDGQLRVPRLAKGWDKHRYKGTKNTRTATYLGSTQVPFGHWRLTVRAKGHAPWTREVALDPEQPSRTLEAGLQAAKGRSRGKKRQGQQGG